MLDRDVQNHLGRRLRAMYDGAAGDGRSRAENRVECGSRLAKAQADLSAALEQRARRMA